MYKYEHMYLLFYISKQLCMHISVPQFQRQSEMLTIEPFLFSDRFMFSSIIGLFGTSVYVCMPLWKEDVFLTGRVYHKFCRHSQVLQIGAPPTPRFCQTHVHM